MPDYIHPEAQVAVLAQNPGVNEEQGQRIVGFEGKRNPIYAACAPQPLIGLSGWLLKKTYLPLAGLLEQQVSYHNILKCRWKHSNDLPTGKVYDEAVTICTEHHLAIQESVACVVAVGRHAFCYTQGQDLSITDWRGFIGPQTYQGKRVYAVLHPSDLLRDPHARFTTRFDWKKLRRLLDGEWPHPVPDPCVASPDNRHLFLERLEEAACQPEILADTEYIPQQQLLTHVGCAWRTGKDSIHGFQVQWVRGSATSVERSMFMRYWKRICEKAKVGFWNAKADLPILEANLHVIPRRIEDPMQAHAVLWPDMEHTYEYVASIYGRYNKLKHLARENMLLYHWGDCIDLVWIWEALKEEFKHEPACEKKYREQHLKLIPILIEAEVRGIRLNQSAIVDAIPQYAALSRDAQTLADSYAGCPLNLGSPLQLVSYLQRCEGQHLRSMDKDAVATARAKFLPFHADDEATQGFSVDYVMERVEQGAHPLLELRTMYAQNEYVNSHYLKPLEGQARCYPTINTHTQAGGRHSITDPPLATLPSDLRHILLPDPQTVWLWPDWDQQEPRIQRAESGSRVLGAAFDEGVDIHTQLVCLLYGWDMPQDLRNPHTSTVDAEWRQRHQWGGKDDPRRVFAKTLRYEINYGGTGEQAAKKAVRMGIQPDIAKNAATVLLNSDPDLRAWFQKVEDEVMRTHIIRAWDGGRRIFYWMDSWMKPDEMKRQARNFPPQGGGSGLLNLTIVEVAEAVPDAKYVFDMHDSIVWQVPYGKWIAVYAQLKRIMEQPRIINGMSVPFPASWKVVYDDGRVEKVT